MMNLRCSAATGLMFTLLGGAFAHAADSGEPPPKEEVFVRTHSMLGESRVASARARGMGGAYAALVNGAASVQENPAALGAMCGKSVTGGISFDSLEDETNTTDVTTINIGGAFSLNAYLPADAANQAVGLAYKQTGFDGPGNTYSGNLDDKTFTASYGRTFGANLLGGASVSVVDGSWKDGMLADPNTANTMIGYPVNSDLEYTAGELLLGGLYRASDTMTLGGIASYATGRARTHSPVSENGDLTRMRVRGGVSWQAAEQTLVTGDIEYAVTKLDFDSYGDSRAKTATIMGGVEQELLPEALVLRGGLYGRQIKYDGDFATVDTTTGAITSKNRNSYKEDYWGFNAGIGARIKSIDLNYTLDIRTTGDIGHVFGVQYDW